ncbi:MAG TPA: tetratricopeptide repeat-containing glycosyltransferase family protein [Rhizomicrobium sp.]|jgi:Flp pilus assembly protein TadD|nr:tetratricopeptide repeat-containing glycosyltransferase family protein [Rhizomicrobium sp.]
MNVRARIEPYEEGLRLSAMGRHALAIECFEQALTRAPDDPRVLFALGNTARALGMDRPAESFYRKVLEREPGRLEAIVNLANLLRAQGRFDSAEALLVPALARNSACAELWLTLGSVYRETGNRVRAIAHYRQALLFRPDYAPALGNLADLVADEGRVEEALDLYGRVLRREPGNAQAKLNRAILHLSVGNLTEGWRDYAARLSLPGKVPVSTHGLARWTGGSLRRIRLLVTAEQGIGDQIMFASVVPDLAERASEQGGSVVLECEPRLVPLLERSFPAVSVRCWDAETRGGVTTARYGWLKHAGGANAAIELGSLPRHFRSGISAFPEPHAYLVPDPDEVSRWKASLPQAAIGICWRSGKTGGHRSLQYAPLEAWAELVRVWPGPVVSVQYDAQPEEIATLESLSGRKIHLAQGIDQKMEIDRTCALLSCLMAVVSAPTAVSWLAAGAGVPTFKILYDRSWTSFGRAREPFAPACVCVMPEVRGRWSSCFDQTIGALRERFPPG